MSLALVISACIAAAALLARWTWRDGAGGARGQPVPRLAFAARVLAAVLLPLAGLHVLTRGHVPAAAPESFQVLGQYVPRGDTVVLGGAAAAADVRLPMLDGDSAAVARVVRDGATRRLHVDATPGMPLVVAGETPVNAAPLGARGTIELQGGRAATLVVTMPRWPASCLLRWASRCPTRVVTLQPGARQRVVRLSETGETAERLFPELRGGADARLFLLGRRPHVASLTPARVRVDGRALPHAATTSDSTVTVGHGRAAVRLTFAAEGDSPRLSIRYDRALQSSPWPVGAGLHTYRVFGGATGEAPTGTLPLLDLSAWPMGSAAATYAGVLARSDDGWSWHQNGRSRAVPTGAVIALPGDGAAYGHLVRVARAGGHASAIATLSVLWIVGALALFANGWAAGAGSAAVRTLLAGLVYTLVMVRCLLALRVSQAAPAAADAIPSAIALLVVLPALATIVERWNELWAPWRAMLRGRSWREWRPGALALPLVLVLAPALAVLAAGGDRSLLGLTVVPLVVGSVGLLGLQWLLLPRESRARAFDDPLAMLESPSDPALELAQLTRAIVALLVIVAFYVELELVRLRVPLLALVVAHALGVATLRAAFALRERVVPRLPRAQVVAGVTVAGLLVALLAAVATGEARPAAGALPAIVSGLLAGIACAGVAWVVARPFLSPLKAGVFRRDDLLPPAWLMLLPAAGLLLARVPGVLRAGITLGFALAVTAMLVMARILTLLWHRDTRARKLRRLRRGGPLGERVRPAQVARALAAAGVLLAGFVVVDRGLFQFLVVVVLTTAVVGTAVLGRRQAMVAMGALLLGVAAWTWAVHVPAERLSAGRVSLSTPSIRFAAARSPEALEQQLVFAEHGDAREIVNTLVQDWGMRAHASLGGTTGVGLFRFPFGESAIRAREALTDNVFPVFVLSEHGFMGGAALLVLYAALALACLAGAAAAARSAAELPRAQVLAGCAMFIAVPALYMTAANVGLVPLTGQNLPLLGLRSGADVALFCWVAMLALAALPRADRGAAAVVQQDTEHAAQRARVRSTVRMAGLATAALTVVVGAAVWQATHATVDRFRMDAFRRRLERLAEDRFVVVQEGRLALAPAADAMFDGRRAGSLLHALVQRANGDAAAGGHCLDQGPWLRAARDGSVRVGDGCTIASVSTGRVAWEGALTTTPEGVARVVDGGEGTLLLTSDAASTVATARCGDGATREARAADLSCAGAARLRFALAKDGTPTVRVREGAALVNGERAGTLARTLAWGDVITVAGAATLVVDSVPRAAMGFSRWRNGELARVVRPGTAPVLARLDSLLATSLRPGAPRQADAVLTLDAALTARIQSALAAACAGALECSVMLVQPDSGDVLAMASWADSSLHVRAWQPVDANFRAHRVASVFKPFAAAAVLARYPAAGDLVVEHPDESFDAAAGWRLTGAGRIRSPFRGCPTAAQRTVGWGCFLPTSNNLYAVTLGMLGAAMPGEDGLPLLEPGGRGPTFHLRGMPSGLRPRFKVVAGQRRFSGTPLARGLADLFDVRLDREIGRYDATLWAPLADAGLLRTGPEWQRVSPEPTQVDFDDPAFVDLRHFAGFLIGETDNQWSNAGLARAMSRLFTGDGIELRLLRQLGTRELAPRRKAGVQFGPRRQDVIDGMRGVVARDFGTAHAVQASVPASDFTFVAKTGTLDSRGARPLSSFMFAGRGPGVQGACAVVGVVHVEAREGTAASPSARELFARVVAPALREEVGWGTARCAVRVPGIIAGR